MLAAGMGSRYGGNKQLDQVGPSGETIIDYSIYDAIRSGFGKIVFVIRRDIEEQVKERFVEKLRDKIEFDYVFQELTNVPEGAKVAPGRSGDKKRLITIPKGRIRPLRLISAGAQGNTPLLSRLKKAANNQFAATILIDGVFRGCAKPAPRSVR